MRRSRRITGVVLGAFSAALTVLPWLHTWHHRDDHIHVDGAIVYLAGNEHEHGHGGDDDPDADAPGFDHPAHHAPHGRGALAHGSAFILAGAIFVLPPPVAALERPPAPPSPVEPLAADQRSPRVTRGPPRAA